MANGKLLAIAFAEYGVAEKQQQAASKYHFVNPKENLYRIALQYNVSVDELKKWNGLPDNNIQIGQQLRVAQSANLAIMESRILQYARETGFAHINSEQDAWCSVAMNWVCMKAGLPRSFSAAARSWLKVGVPVDDIHDADIVVYYRDGKDSVYGHVGIPLNYTDDKKSIWTYGGNQSNMWCVKPYPVERLLGFRKLT